MTVTKINDNATTTLQKLVLIAFNQDKYLIDCNYFSLHEKQVQKFGHTANVLCSTKMRE